MGRRSAHKTYYGPSANTFYCSSWEQNDLHCYWQRSNGTDVIATSPANLVSVDPWAEHSDTNRGENSLYLVGGHGWRRAGNGPSHPHMHQEMRVWSLGQEDPLEKEMTIHSSIAWRIPWTEEPGRLQSVGSQKSQTRLSMYTLYDPQTHLNVCRIVWPTVQGNHNLQSFTKRVSILG